MQWLLDGCPVSQSPVRNVKVVGHYYLRVMATYSYEYSTIIQNGYEVGIIRCGDVDFLAQFDEALARHHRPDDQRLVIWDGAHIIFGPDVLTALFRAGTFNSSGLEWSRHSLKFD